MKHLITTEAELRTAIDNSITNLVNQLDGMDVNETIDNIIAKHNLDITKPYVTVKSRTEYSGYFGTSRTEVTITSSDSIRDYYNDHEGTCLHVTTKTLERYIQSKVLCDLEMGCLRLNGYDTHCDYKKMTRQLSESTYFTDVSNMIYTHKDYRSIRPLLGKLNKTINKVLKDLK